MKKIWLNWTHFIQAQTDKQSGLLLLETYRHTHASKHCRFSRLEISKRIQADMNDLNNTITPPGQCVWWGWGGLPFIYTGELMSKWTAGVQTGGWSQEQWDQWRRRKPLKVCGDKVKLCVKHWVIQDCMARWHWYNRNTSLPYHLKYNIWLFSKWSAPQYCKAVFWVTIG